MYLVISRNNHAHVDPPKFEILKVMGDKGIVKMIIVCSKNPYGEEFEGIYLMRNNVTYFSVDNRKKLIKVREVYTLFLTDPNI